jgi:hypothetical protein
MAFTRNGHDCAPHSLEIHAPRESDCRSSGLACQRGGMVPRDRGESAALPVLHLPPVDGPVMAVKPGVLAEYKQGQR